MKVRTQFFAPGPGKPDTTVSLISIDEFLVRARKASSLRYSKRELLDWLLSMPIGEYIKLGDRHIGISLFWLEK